MKKYLSDYAVGKDNNLNLLRFVAASLVIFSHSYPLSGNLTEPLALWGLSFGHIAVDIFFIVSGLLITQSLLKADIGFFIYRRIIRIYPGLIAAVLFCVFFVGISQTSLSIRDYLTNKQIYTFAFYNSALILKPIHYALPGVFESNPYPVAVNGSLWTLPWEIRMYALLTLLGIFTFTPLKFLKKSSLPKIITVSAIVSTVLYIVGYLSEPSVGHDAARFTSFFFIGGTFSVYRHKIPLSHSTAILCVSLLVLSLFNLTIFYVFYCLLIPFLTLYLAYVPAGKIRLFNHMGDYSYGMYIYAFPVQQLIAKTVDNVSVVQLFLSSWVITLVLAILSWHYIEQPVLKQKTAYFKLKKTGTQIINRVMGASKR